MSDRQYESLIDWLKALAELFREVIAWVREIPAEIGAQISEIRNEVRIGLIAFGVLILVHAFIRRKS